MEYEDIIFKKDDGIATITLNRPQKLNALTPVMIKSIRSAAQDADQDDEVRVLVVTGAGRAFCSGQDVSALAGRATETSGAERVKLILTRGEMAYERPMMQSLGKPVIAAVNGPAVGFGAELATMCDFRIVSDRARFGWVFTRRGIVPDIGGCYLLPRLVGVEKACELIFTGDIIEAQEAERIGLVSKVVPHEELETATRALADRLKSAAPLAIRFAKHGIYTGLRRDFEWAMEYANFAYGVLFQTDDVREGMAAFKEKRKPIFKGY
ncbi:enoyl-CoA hydratase/isomerase family protein [Chloroflexota bacterium]